jgi:hypothetical protein
MSSSTRFSAYSNGPHTLFVISQARTPTCSMKPVSLTLSAEPLFRLCRSLTTFPSTCGTGNISSIETTRTALRSYAQRWPDDSRLSSKTPSRRRARRALVARQLRDGRYLRLDSHLAVSLGKLRGRWPYESRIRCWMPADEEMPTVALGFPALQALSSTQCWKPWPVAVRR